ncbi:MAG TPA: hypothetical protein VJK08_00225 [Patescibacteria group bacterium]|nr:hypothetical protein [Patescibacteria group bacterium]
MVKVLYKLFLGIMVALFIGFGISVFYPAPTQPDYPTEIINTSPENIASAEKKTNTDFNKAQKDYQQKFAVYRRNVSAIAVISSVVLLILSLMVLLNISIIGDGILLGGIFTLAYGIIRAFMSDSNKFQFGVVTIGLIVALTLGYWKFLRLETKK